MVSGVFTQVHLTVSPVGPGNHPVFISPVPGLTGIGILSNQQNPTCSFPNLWSKGFSGGKGQVKPL